MNNTKIIIKGARENNLKNIDLEIPKNKLIVITGVSGSGKSSLAFDTIYAEGQRRYVESLSSYARQFLGVMKKPDLDYIDGLSPAISIDQKTASRNPRSTVGTTTEIYDYLRLLYSKIGIPYCPKCGSKIEHQTIEQITEEIMKIKDKKIIILSPIIRNKKGEYIEILDNFFSKGFTRARIDNIFYSLDEDIKLDRYKSHNIDIVLNRLIIKDEDIDIKSRINESVERAALLSEGEVIIHIEDDNKDILYSENLSCLNCHTSIPEIQPNTFSFNSPYGACENCSGLGIIESIEEDLIYNPKLTFMEGALYLLSNEITHYKSSWIIKIIQEVASKNNIPLDIPFQNYTKEQLKILMYGTGNETYKIQYKPRMRSTKTYSVTFMGIIPHLLEKYSNGSDSVKREISEYMKQMVCEVCKGTKLNKIARSIKIDNKSIDQVSKIHIDEFVEWISKIKEGFTDSEKFISKQILQEIESRAKFLDAVGVWYLSLDRSSKTLAGGEAQRIRLASQIGSKLSGILYVLDEPSIGLHQRDNMKLIETLKELKDLGNTVIVVEHDEETMENADHIIDIGPGAGVYGGEVIATGDFKDIKNNPKSITGKYLSKKEKIEIPKKRRDYKKYLEINGAKEHNLKNINVKIPLETFTVVTGVSGSGKSTLINDILYPYISNEIYNTKKIVGECEYIDGIENINKIIDIDQSPIGKTPRSNPATYTGAFTFIRELFASTKISKMKGYKAGRFSFNVKGGRCETCKGDGIIKIEMQFLPDIYVTCEECKGKRYNKEALEIEYKGKNISEILDMTIKEAILFFENIQSIKTKMKTLDDVGLGYIKLGQSATTLSGGESQRIKLASELSRRATGKTLYILDEPTTGLHFDDIKKLLKVLNKLVDQKNTVLVIEHNMDVIKIADWIIDLGKEGGDKGGNIIFEGIPENIIKDPNSYTGKYLKKYI
jgi:excinuclease ABC subunit A